MEQKILTLPEHMSFRFLVVFALFILLKVEKDTMGQKKLVHEFFLNFIYIVLWDVPNKISKFENRFPGLFKKYSPIELPPSEIQKNVIFFTSLCD